MDLFLDLLPFYGALLQHVDVADPKIGCLQLVLLVKSVEVPI
jgi:hypothetical protein